MRRRIGAALAYGLMAAPALAGALPIDGAFGNDAGCHLFARGEASGDYQLLTADTFSSTAMGCAFLALLSTQQDVFTLAAVCSPGGKVTVTITDRGTDGYAVAIADKSWGSLKACPPSAVDGDGATTI